MKFRSKGKFVSITRYIKENPGKKIDYSELTTKQKRQYNGHKQAKYRVRVSGEFITHTHEIQIKQYAKNNNMEVKEYIRQNKEAIMTYMKDEAVFYHVDSKDVDKYIDKAFNENYKVSNNDEIISKTELKAKITELNRFLTDNGFSPDWYMQSIYRENKKTLNYEIPNISDLKGMTPEEIQKTLKDNFNITVWINTEGQEGEEAPPEEEDEYPEEWDLNDPPEEEEEEEDPEDIYIEI